MAGNQKRTYILVYSNKLDRDRVREIVREMSFVGAWRYDLPHCFYLVSKHSAEDLAEQFQRLAGDDHGQFLIMEATDNSQGWLPKASWHIINEQELLKTE